MVVLLILKGVGSESFRITYLLSLKSGFFDNIFPGLFLAFFRFWFLMT